MKTTKDPKPLTGWSSLQRPRFTPGLLLEDEDLTAGVDYTRELTRLLFSSLFGCGVICGLEVEARLICNGTQVEVKVKRGIALDCRGNPISVPKDQPPIVYDAGCDPLPASLWVKVCYVEKPCQPRDVSCSPDDAGHAEPTRVRQGFEISVESKQPRCACSCGKPVTEPTRTPGTCCPPATNTTGAPGTDQPQTGQPGVEQQRGGPGPTIPPCPCYEDHARGVCACDCGCACVVIARIDTKPEATDDPQTGTAPAAVPQGDRDLVPHMTFVRQIRPVLIGHMNCRYPDFLPKRSTGTLTPGSSSAQTAG